MTRHIMWARGCNTIKDTRHGTPLCSLRSVHDLIMTLSIPLRFDILSNDTHSVSLDKVRVNEINI